MIHIVFNEADVAVLQQAIELDESLQGEVMQVSDDYAVGPLKDKQERTGGVKYSPVEIMMGK